MEKLTDRYSPQDVERRTYQWWETQGFFESKDKSTKPPYAIILPPPNVTGQLHIGHALNHTIQDVLCRWRRMSGYNVNWLPGTDHAGIATQGVVERELAAEGLQRKSMGRDAFVARVWDWKERYGNRIVDQMKRLGGSYDWKRFMFTLDPAPSKAVRKVFVDLYKAGLIYRGTRLINWSPKLESALSDLEVEYKEIKGQLYHIKYRLSGSDQYLVVATTRPETLLGDTAVVVHPDDDRYKKFIGKSVELPLTGRKIPVISDSHVDQAFGSGVVKVTPAHDFNDYEMGQRHKLPMISILTLDGTLNENGGTYKGLKVQEARKRIVEDLKNSELLEKVEPHTHSVGHCSRSGAVVEPMLSEQWFMKMASLAGPAKSVVANGTVTIEPESWTKVYLHWLNNIQDWCVSRQLWWGHRIPAWHCESCKHVTVSEVDPSACEKCNSKSIRQEEDVLDTWFSSALWPFSTLGWPQKTEALKTFYPTDVLVTGHDIIFFWVARMIMMGLHLQGDVPFRKVLFTGLVRNEQGQKMSKSLGNALDPVEIIESHGADALRFTLTALMASGRDIKFSTQRLDGYRNFMNKIWNAARFSLGVLEDFPTASQAGTQAQPLPLPPPMPNRNDLSDADKWIIQKTGRCEMLVNDHLSKMRFADAAQALYEFIWNDFCDWYLELVKPKLYGEKNHERTATQRVLAETLNRICRLLHPIAPFITEEIYQKLPLKNAAAIVDTYPTPKNDKEWLALGDEQAAGELDLILEVITAIRNIRGENRIKPGEPLRVRLAPQDEKAQKVLQSHRATIEHLGRVGECLIAQEGPLSKCARSPIRRPDYGVDVVVYLEGLVDLDEERKRLEKTAEKMQKDLSGLRGRLENPNFVNHAPPEVVAADRAQITELEEKIEVVRSSLTYLQ
jgi:valyl-tRNA synthetase